ncbi:hypothetical protein ABPG75_003802 [Micractinium tetrahymenae]
MVPTLQQLAMGTLIRYKHCLSDVGAVPVDLLGEVLALCSAEELQDIEDGTREGSGRELSPWLWPFWWALLLARGGPPAPGERAPPLPAAAEVAPGPPGVPPADYRQGSSALYEQRLADLERKRAESGARLRALWEEEERQRAARHVVVVDPLPARKRQRSDSAPPFRAPGAWPNPHRQLLAPALHAGPSAKERLLKKLGMARAASSGGGGHGSRGPVVRRTIIMPAGRLAAGAAGAAGAAAGSGPAGSSGWLAQRQQLAAAPSAAALRQSSLPVASGGGRVLGSPGGTSRSAAATQSPAPGHLPTASTAAAAANSSPALRRSAPVARAAEAAADHWQVQQQSTPNKLPVLSAGLDLLFIPKKKPSASAAWQPSPAVPTAWQPSLSQSPASALGPPHPQQQPEKQKPPPQHLHCSGPQQQRCSQQPRQQAQSGGCPPASAPPRPQQPQQRQARPAPLQECDIFADADAEAEQREQQERWRRQLGRAGLKRPAAAGGAAPAPAAHKRPRQRPAASLPAARPLQVRPLEEFDLFEGL